MAAGDKVQSGNFTFTETSIEGVVVVDVRSYGDERGYFMETYKRPDFEAGGIACDFVQDNQSSSTRGVLRGLHFQIDHPQSKLVRVVSGEVFDVAVRRRVPPQRRGRPHVGRPGHRRRVAPALGRRGLRPGQGGPERQGQVPPAV